MQFLPIIVIPSYNTGADLLRQTVVDALNHCRDIPVAVHLDGSTDGSATALQPLVQADARLTLHTKPGNTGKGDTLRLAGLSAAANRFTHLLAMDADGQHPGTAIPSLLAAAANQPKSIIMGKPQFGPEAPKARLYGRRLTTFWTSLETPSSGLGDTLFGMRVYPLAAFNRAFRQTPFARGFDFDPEIAVRMVWLGCQPVQVPVAVRYLRGDQGGVSHFHYVRDNVKLTLLHFRLIPEFLLFRWIQFLQNRRQWTR